MTDAKQQPRVSAKSVVVGVLADRGGNSDSNNINTSTEHETPEIEPKQGRTQQGRDDDKRREEAIQQQASHNVLYLSIVNIYSTFVIFVFYLISLEGLLSMALSAGLTVFVYHRNVDNIYFSGGTMSWTLLSVAVVTPMVDTILMAFRRRENGLRHVADLRATLLQIYLAHAVWDFDYKKDGHGKLKPDEQEENGPVIISTGRERSSVDWVVHSDQTCREILGLCNDLYRWLTLPNATRARHRVTPAGKREAVEIEQVASYLHQSCVVRMARLADLCETLKREGLPPNEATRIRQWERFCLEFIEKLRTIKAYRTPQALRSFSRLFSMILPPFYAPFYSQMAVDLHSLGMAIAYSLIAAIALTSLFECLGQMEDPFVEMSHLDGIHVHCEFVQDFTARILALRSHFFPHAGPFGDDGVCNPPSSKRSLNNEFMMPRLLQRQ